MATLHNHFLFIIETIGDSAFEVCDSLKDVYYSGSNTDWKEIGNSNAPLSGGDTTLHCDKEISAVTLAGLTGDGVVRYTVTTTASDTMKVYLIAAQYEKSSGKLQEIKLEESDLTDGTLEFTVKPASSDYIIKVFLLNKDHEPLCEACDLPVPIVG